ncbi:MAG: DUF2207 domain-containing protein [Methanomicrobiales archaeon]|nr:DUF2207 domain-containing protein [Methanomicrobiales archaeon]
MREGRQIALLFAVTLAMGLGAVALAYPFGTFPSLEYAAVLFVLGTPFLFLLLYVVHGREPDETVPRYLSEVPNPARKPWVVNLVFRSDTFTFTYDGFYATVLDLQTQGFVELGSREPDGQVPMKVLNYMSEDTYEQNVLSFLGFIGEARIPDQERMGDLFTSVLQRGGSLPGLIADIILRRMLGRSGASGPFSLGILIRPPEDAVSGFFEDGRRRVVPIFLAAAAFYLIATFLPLFLGEGYGSILYSGLFTAIFAFVIFLSLLMRGEDRSSVGQFKDVLLFLFLGFLFVVAVLPDVVFGGITAPQVLMYVVGFQCLAATLFPRPLLGRWKADAYREKLQWDAFRAFLSDMVKIREYSQADRTMWGRWLIYGTALGVGDGVASAMQDLRIQIPQTEMAEAVKVMVQQFAEVTAKDPRFRQTEGL